MKISKVVLQLSGIDLASLKESEILEQIEKGCNEKGIDPATIGEVNVYINIEGTAVTAYYTCDGQSGSIRLN